VNIGNSKEYTKNPNRDTNREFIKGLYEDYGLEMSSNKEVYEHFDDAISNGLVPSDKNRSSWEGECRRIRLLMLREEIYVPIDDETSVIKHNISLDKKNQRLMDLNRVHNKEKREDYRAINALEAMNESLIELLEKNNLKEFTKKHKVVNNSDNFWGVFHMTDLHGNEMVRLGGDSLTNSYDFTVLSKRAHKMVVKAKKHFKVNNVKNVVIALGGDLLNSSRRLDELVSASTNRMSAALLVVYILEQVILDLNKDFNVVISSVIGNESRLLDFVTHSPMIANENFDYLIDNMLRIIFKDAKGISFAEGNYLEKVVSLDGFNLLMLHGDRLKHNSLEKDIHSKIAKYAQVGITIHHVIFGHLHNALLSDYYSRGGSTVGSNSYSENALNLIGRASQNIYIVDSKNKSLDGIKLDLEKYDEYEGYDIKKELERYNAKSTEKLYKHETVFKIVI